MIRNLKTLGLALAAVLAMSVVAVPSASAVEFHSEAAETILEGAATEGAEWALEGGTIECASAKFEGKMTGTTGSKITVTPSYSECTGFGGFPTTVNMNGCTYVFDSGTQEGESIEGSEEISCPEGKVVDFHITSFGTLKCTVTISAGKRKGIKWTNQGAGSTRDLLAHVHVPGLVYYQHKGTGFGACATGGAEFGTRRVTWTVTARTPGGSHVGIWLQ